MNIDNMTLQYFGRHYLVNITLKSDIGASLLKSLHVPVVLVCMRIITYAVSLSTVVGTVDIRYIRVPKTHNNLFTRWER